MGFYNDVILPRLCDFAMRNKRLVPYRERVIGAAVALIDHVSPPPVAFSQHQFGKWTKEGHFMRKPANSVLRWRMVLARGYVPFHDSLWA